MTHVQPLTTACVGGAQHVPVLLFSKRNTKPAVISHLKTLKNSVDKEQKLELWRQLQQVAIKSRGLLLHPLMLLRALVQLPMQCE